MVYFMFIYSFLFWGPKACLSIIISFITLNIPTKKFYTKTLILAWNYVQLNQGFPNFFQKSPITKLKKLWPPPTRLLKKLPLKTPTTFFLLFIVNSRIFSVSFKLWHCGPPVAPLLFMANFGKPWIKLNSTITDCIYELLEFLNKIKKFTF